MPHDEDKRRPRYVKHLARERSLFTTSKATQRLDTETVNIIRRDSNKANRIRKLSTPRSFTGKIVRAMETAPRSSGKGRALAMSTRDYQAQCEGILASVRKLTESIKKAYAKGDIPKALRLKAKREEQLEKLELMTLERFS